MPPKKIFTVESDLFIDELFLKRENFTQREIEELYQNKFEKLSFKCLLNRFSI